MDTTTLIDSLGNKYLISSEQDLIMSLDIIKTNQPQISVLDIPEFGILTFGVSKTIGFVEFMAENRRPPYMIANTKEITPNEKFMDFDSGGTATPIPIKYCIPVDLVLIILVESYKNRELPDSINWYNELIL